MITLITKFLYHFITLIKLDLNSTLSKVDTESYEAEVVKISSLSWIDRNAIINLRTKTFEFKAGVISSGMMNAIQKAEGSNEPNLEML